MTRSFPQPPRYVVPALGIAIFGCSGGGAVSPGEPNDAGTIRGNVHVGVSRADCSRDRIAKISAIPAVLGPGERATVEIEPVLAAIEGDASVVLSARIEVDGGVGEDVWNPSEDCAPNAIACGYVSCPDPLDASDVSGRTLVITVTLEDRDCFDRESLLVECE